MELKKNESLDLEKKRPLFFNIGLVIALTATAVAFNWKSEYEKVVIDRPEEIFNELYKIPITRIPEPPRPKTPKPKKVINNQTPVLVETDIPSEILEKTTIIDNEPDVIPTDFFIPEEPPVEVPEQPFDIVENMPSFPGGMEAFYRYVSKNIEYPRAAKRMGIEGKVFVQFVIDKDGKIIEAKAIKGIGAGCDEEAELVLSNSPKWNPGKQRGREVKVRMVLPISFRLN